MCFALCHKKTRQSPFTVTAPLVELEHQSPAVNEERMPHTAAAAAAAAQIKKTLDTLAFELEEKKRKEEKRRLQEEEELRRKKTEARVHTLTESYTQWENLRR